MAVFVASVTRSALNLASNLFRHGASFTSVKRTIQGLGVRGLWPSVLDDVRALKGKFDVLSELKSLNPFEKIPETLTVNTALKKPYNFMVHALIQTKDKVTGLVKEKMVSWYTDALKSPQEYLAEYVSKTETKKYEYEGQEYSLVSVEGVYHNSGFPYESYAEEQGEE